MEDYSSPLDEGIEELKHCVLYISELEATIVAANDEIRRREIEILNLKHILTKTMKERNEAEQESKKLSLEKLIIQQQTADESENGRRALPEKGKLLEAVKEAGPLLHTLLLAGPLPQWQHPPPPPSFTTKIVVDGYNFSCFDNLS
ncbi:uncharacterized protein [Euphorbia lathyris]|uniref:uncharacterized protein n=1 Tax=Euphorbia lathyris TaxID=212925 RepID=UPI0033130CF8